MTEEQNNTDPTQMMEAVLRTTLAGSLASFWQNKPADSQNSEVSRYLDMVKGENRYFHGVEYLVQCIALLREVPDFLLEDKPHLIAAILFHKVYYDPRKGLKSIRKSCEIASRYYPGEKTVALFSLIKATRFSALIKHRYHDDRAYIADIVMYVYGLPWEEFRQVWAKILREFDSANYRPVRFKKLTAKQLRKMLNCAQRFGFFQTSYFRERFEAQAISNVKQLLEEISS